MKRGIITNRNKFILGPSGSGKSFFTNHLVRQYYEQGTHILLVDTGNSYQGLCRMIHDRTRGEDGIYITYKEDNPIAFNPFYTDCGLFDVEKRESIKTLILTLWKREDEAPKRSEEVALSGAVLAVPGLPDPPRPDAVILGYPVITAGEYAHRGSFVQLAGEDPAAQQAFSLEDKITPRTPPVFVWHTMEDETVPVENTLLLVSALHRAGVPCEAHLFEKGCHGTSLSTAEVNHPSAHRSRWLTLAREWLDDTFDFHLGTGETGG